VFSFTNDSSLSEKGIWVLGFSPFDQINKIIDYAIKCKKEKIGFISVDNDYGKKIYDIVKNSEMNSVIKDKIFINDKITGVIDFYFSCTDILTYDLAIAINAWCFDKQYNFQDKKYQALLKGYNSKRKLSKDEEFFLPLLCQAASLRFLLTRLFDWVNTPIEANVVLKNPEEYITKHKHFKKLVKNIKYVEN